MSDAVKQAIRRALGKVAERIRDRAIDEAPYVKGRLKRSITVHDEFDDKVIISAGDGDAPYAPFVHEGTGRYGHFKRPYVIKPRNNKALSWKGGKHPVKKVNHPGIKPNPFLLRAAKKTAPDIDRLIGGDVAKAAADNIKKQLKDIKIEIKL